MKKTIALFIIIQIVMVNAVQAKIALYEKYIGDYTNPTTGQGVIILRRLKKAGDKHYQYLSLNPDNLKMRWIDADTIKRSSWESLSKKYKGTPYIILRNKAKSLNRQAPYTNRGIKNTGVKGKMVITTDLCPTAKALNLSLYQNLIDKMTEMPVPIAIAVSGKWIEKHPEGLRWLKSSQRHNRLSITWVNHSYHHHYSKNEPINNNFMLKKPTDVGKEIFGVEKLFISEQLVPSIYFRFPGLVSDEKLYKTVLDYGLVPIGSDSWIAKQQFPQDGSIVLLHGNGNERIGVRKFNNWLDSQKKVLTAISLDDAFVQ